MWGFDRWSKEFKLDPEVWLNDIKNQCLRIRCFTGSAKFDSLLLMALSRSLGAGMTANWEGIKTVLIDSWYCLWTASYQAFLISRARWMLRYWSLQLPNAQFDLQYLFGLIIFTPFWASQAGFFFRNNIWVMAILVKNLFLDNPGQECTPKSLLFVIFPFIMPLFKKASHHPREREKMLQDLSEPWDTVENK